MPTLMLLSGPAGAGKSTALDVLQRMVGSRHRLAVVDRDWPGRAVGHHVTTPYTPHHAQANFVSWQMTLAAAEQALLVGWDTIVASPVVPHEIHQFLGRYEKWHIGKGIRPLDIVTAVLLPPTEQIVRQRNGRMLAEPNLEGVTDEEAVLGRAEHAEAISVQRFMAYKLGIFDVVVDGSERRHPNKPLSPEYAAKQIGGALLAMSLRGTLENRPKLRDMIPGGLLEVSTRGELGGD